MEPFLSIFIPLFVAIDPLGTLPFYLGLTEGFSPREKKKLAVQAILTAFAFTLLFSLAGQRIFKFLGITSSDFQIAGGLLLLIFSVQEIFGHPTKRPTGDTADNFVGIVPLGIPVIAGPALVTTILILLDQYAFPLIVGALVANLLVTLVLYLFSEQIVAKLGEATSRASAKIVAILLAAIGVMMIRRGIEIVILGLEKTTS